MADIAGVAGALVTGLQMVAGASASAAAASLSDGHTAIAMTGTMALCASGALLVYLFVVRPAERRLGHPRTMTEEVEIAAMAETVAA
jgi:DHA1 family bicyclomycin/chloramphenicol resistance-like MFS transporter